jgi:hypothetical protein
MRASTSGLITLSGAILLGFGVVADMLRLNALAYLVGKGKANDGLYFARNNNRPEYAMIGGVLLVIVGLAIALDLKGRLVRLWDSVPVSPENGPRNNQISN